MNYTLRPAKSLSEMWFKALKQADASSGRRILHLVMTVKQPECEDKRIREILDNVLKDYDDQSVDTVANTIFPRSLYADPGFDWVPNRSQDRRHTANQAALPLTDAHAQVGSRPQDRQHAIKQAADALYDNYNLILSLLRTAHANRMGTYFSRMISWPGKESGGTNQLDCVIQRLRDVHNNGQITNNTLDMDISADCLNDTHVDGAQVYAATDKRIRGFPCLVHIDFSLLDGLLHCSAVYRHHYLIEKAYGNLLGLSWLMRFICQQTGFKMGELVILSTVAGIKEKKKAERVINEIQNKKLF